MSEPLRLVSKAQHDKQELIDRLEEVLKHLREAEDGPGPWAIAVGMNCGGDARVTYVGNAHEVLALASRIMHSANRAIDGQ